MMREVSHVCNCLTVYVTVHQRQSVLTALKQFSVAETVGVTVFQSWVPKMVGVTVYQSVLTAVGSFRFLRWLASLSIKVS